MGLKEFGAKLSLLRKAKGLTQEELAEQVEVSPFLVSRWENGQKKPGRKKIVGLIKIFAGQLTSNEAWDWAQQAGQPLARTELQLIFPRSHVELPRPPVALAQHPPLPNSYVPRRELERRLLKHLPPKSAGSALVLYGPGGSGKSTLAAWAAEKLKRYFSDGVIWIPYQGVAETQQWLARSLQVTLTGASLAERVAELRTLLRSRSCLLVFDDIWDQPDPAAQSDLTHLKVHHNGCPLILTTRDKTVAHLFEAPAALNVAGLTRPEGRTLLRYWAGVEITGAETDRLLDSVEDLPLAIALIGAQLQNGYSPADLLAALAQEPADLTILDLDPPLTYRKSLVRCFDVSYEALDQIARQYFARLGCFTGTFTIADAAAVWGLTNLNQVHRILDRLVRWMLVMPDGRGYRLHNLLRGYAWQRLAWDWPDLHWLTQERYTMYFIRHFLYHPQLWQKEVGEAPVLDWAWPDIVAGVQWAAVHRPGLAVQAALLAHTERPALLEAVGRPLLEAIKNHLEVVTDPSEQALLHEILGDLYLLDQDTGPGLAHFEQAGRLWTGIENGLAAGQAWLRLAGVRLLRQEWSAAAESARQAQALVWQSLPLAAADESRAARLFYWFNMVYTPLARWPDLPEEDVAGLARLATQTGRPLLQARGLNIYQMWCTARDIPRPAVARQLGRALAAQAFWLWRKARRYDRADDEIRFARYRLSKRYSRQAAARFARRRSKTTPRLDPGQRQLFKESHPAIYWWLGAIEKQRVGWLSWMLPRYLGVVDLPRRPSKNKAGPLPALRPGSRAYGWVEEILNLGTLGSAGRRLAKHWQPPPDHFLNGPEWRVLSGQRIFPLEAPEARAVVAQYLADLEQKLG